MALPNINISSIFHAFSGVTVCVFYRLLQLIIFSIHALMTIVMLSALPIKIIVISYKVFKMTIKNMMPSNSKNSAKFNLLKLFALEKLQWYKKFRIIEFILSKAIYSFGLVSISCQNSLNFITDTKSYKSMKQLLLKLMTKVFKYKKVKRYENEIEFQEWRVNQKVQFDLSQLEELRQQICQLNQRVCQMQKENKVKTEYLQISIKEQSALQRKNLGLRQEVVEKCRFVEDLKLKQRELRQILSLKQIVQVKQGIQNKLAFQRQIRIEQLIRKNEDLKRKIHQYEANRTNYGLNNQNQPNLCKSQKLNPERTQTSTQKQQKSQLSYEQEQTSENSLEDISQQKNQTQGNLRKGQKKSNRKNNNKKAGGKGKSEQPFSNEENFHF